MKKVLHSTLAGLLACTLLAGCLAQDAGRQGTAPPAMAGSSSAAAQSAPTQPVGDGRLRVMLPAQKEALAEVLTQMAGAEGLALDVRTESAASPYAAQVREAIESDDPPDIVYLEGEAEARVVGQELLADLTGSGVSPAVSGLAQMAPAGSRLLQENKVYGLPLGYFAEGYIINIEVMAALLGTQNTAALQSDLQNCSFEQWSMMLEALEIYLQGPSSIRMKVGDGTYTMPRYRPKVAQPLRGIFAVSDGDAAALMQGALSAACFAPYENPAQWLATSEEELQENLFPSLESLYGLLDYETMHMARPEGAVYRGEAYAVRDALGADEANQLFAEGTALLLRGDSRRALRLEAENPQLRGKLVMVPVKLPPPVLPEEEEEGTSASDSSGSQSAADSSLPAEETTAEKTAAMIEQHNTQLWYASDGYLCLSGKARNVAAAEALLLQLYTTEEGIAAVANQLYLHSIGDLLPATPLATQVSRVALTGSGSLLPTPPDVLTEAGAQIGAYVAEELMHKTEWDDEDAVGFLTTSLAGLGYRMSYEDAALAGEAG